LILGDREREEREVTWRRYGSRDQESMTLEIFLEQIQSEIKNRVRKELAQ
jgi:threonyl-tRNA synthetase